MSNSQGSRRQSPEAESLPDGLHHARTTPVFDQDTVPAGLLSAHRIANGVWGRLVVYSGAVTFSFEDRADQSRQVSEGEYVVIPPDRPHHLTVEGPATFAIEFHRSD